MTTVVRRLVQTRSGIFVFQRWDDRVVLLKSRGGMIVLHDRVVLLKSRIVVRVDLRNDV